MPPRRFLGSAIVLAVLAGCGAEPGVGDLPVTSTGAPVRDDVGTSAPSPLPPEPRAASPASPASRTDLARLFSGPASALPLPDQAHVFALLGLRPDPADPAALLDGVCGLPVDSEVELRDLNGDGVDEVLVVIGSTCLFGGTGAGTTLFVRDASGELQSNLGFGGIIVERIPAAPSDFPDLRLAGMSDCHAIWRWDGSRYEHLRNDPTRPGGCDFLPR
jgi:hypothetical protein